MWRKEVVSEINSMSIGVQCGIDSIIFIGFLSNYFYKQQSQLNINN